MNPRPASNPREELRAAGIRATAQRALILDILRRSGGHLDADEIHAVARAQDASVSLATVYRTLRALRLAGLIHQRYFGAAHNHDHYETAGEAEHHHLACARCGRVEEFETALGRRLTRELQARHGWVIQKATILVEGLCPDCARASQG
jgi:Fur family transcriptional regulator, ferric uptake regulator